MLEDVGAALEVFVVGEDFSAEGDCDRSLAVGLRSRVDALRVEVGVSVGCAALGGSVIALLDALLGVCSVLAGVRGSNAVSATRRDVRRAGVGRDESVVVCADASDLTGGAGSDDAARGVAAGPGVGGADTSERSESPSKASIVVV